MLSQPSPFLYSVFRGQSVEFVVFSYEIKSGEFRYSRGSFLRKSLRRVEACADCGSSKGQFLQPLLRIPDHFPALLEHCPPALYPEKAAVIRGKLSELSELEKRAGSREESDLTPAALLDRTGSIFGDLLAEVFDCRKDTWSPALRRVGFNLGKFIYILDAYDDLEKDEKNGSFNPLLSMKDKPHLDDYVRGVLTMTLSDCTGAFETLPVVENIDILRNILYCGIWCKFEEVYRKRTGVMENSADSTERTPQDE